MCGRREAAGDAVLRRYVFVQVLVAEAVGRRIGVLQQKIDVSRVGAGFQPARAGGLKGRPYVTLEPL